MNRRKFCVLIGGFLFFLFTQPLHANPEFFTKRGELVEFQQCPSEQTPLGDQNQMKQLFVESFSKSYRLTGAHSELSDWALQEYLESDFEEIIRPLLYNKPPKIFLGAKVGGKLAGYALFEEVSPDTVYVAELAISSEFWRQGLGRKMTLFYADSEPRVRKVVVLTERINSQAQQFYESIGFQSSTYTHEGYPVERFCAYEKTVR